jgi:SAM-dependent methyltransferase
MNKVYDHPKYYEVAFSFRNIPREVDLFEECIRRYAKVSVKTFLELACGNGPHLNELLSRHYRYIGLDLNEPMLEYTRRKISNPSRATLISGDLCRFRLGEPVQFVFVALGSLYVKNTDDLIDHFDSVSRVLPAGGLYLLDWCVYFSSMPEMSEAWDIEQEETRIQVTVKGRIIEPAEQLYEEAITLEVTENGRTTRYSGIDQKRIIYPQEFLLLIEHKTDFEFIGWWNNWDLNDPIPSKIPINRPIALLRKR